MIEKTMNISFSVNEDVLLTLKEIVEEFTQNMRFASALMWYRKNKLSLGKAAELAGYSKLDFIERMKLENEAIFDYSPNQMAEIFADAHKKAELSTSV
jgi:predicted HTH domain antitoxin